MMHGNAPSRHDLFSLMLGTSEDEGSAAMTDEELVSTIAQSPNTPLTKEIPDWQYLPYAFRRPWSVTR